MIIKLFEISESNLKKIQFLEIHNLTIKRINKWHIVTLKVIFNYFFLYNNLDIGLDVIKDAWR